MTGRHTYPKQMTILHVEDEPALAQMVRIAFESFGYRGDILRVGLVAEAIALLHQRERDKAPLDLILVDMQLPDGNGLEVVREVKRSPVWQRTPVIVLSGETAPGLINDAYALGANSYMPKLSRTKGAIGSVQALYHYWIDGAILPQPPFTAPAREVLAKAVHLQARIAEFYFALARASAAVPQEEKFWLDRALVEGNLSNLFAFFQGMISERDIPAQRAERAAAMQLQVEGALAQAEGFLKVNPDPTPEEICSRVLDLMEAWDEEVLAEAIGILLLKSPTVTRALKARAVCQIRELACHLLELSKKQPLNRRAEALLAQAGRLAAMESQAERKPADGRQN